MTTVTWPATLPRPTFDGYRLKRQDPIARTEMESGPARQRRRYSQVPTRIPVRWRFTAWEFALFEAWTQWDAKDGAEWFAIDLLGGIGMASHDARFFGQGGQPYDAQPLRGGRGGGVTWIVTATLEVRDHPVLSASALDILLAEDGPGLLSALASANSLVHSTLPAINW